jgi:hypothetical protein
LALGPPVPFDWLLWHDYEATEPFDLICLARSPSFTPSEADAVYGRDPQSVHRRERDGQLSLTSGPPR